MSLQEARSTFVRHWITCWLERTSGGEEIVEVIKGLMMVGEDWEESSKPYERTQNCS